MTTPFPKIFNTQIAEKSILDAFNKQTYLGNSFILPTIATTISDSNEHAICYVSNPSTNQKALFMARRSLTASATTILKFYQQPSLSNPGGTVNPLNLRPAYGTESISTCYLYPTAAAAVGQVTKFVFSQVGSFYDVTGTAKAIQLFNNGLGYYFWFNVTDGDHVQTDPLLIGTGTQVDVLKASTAAQVATLFYTPVAALTGIFTATNTPAGSVNVTNVAKGTLPTADSVTGSAATMSITTPGANIGSSTYLGSLSTVVNVTNHAFGLIVLDPGYSFLVTATVPGSSGTVYVDLEWYEL